jgi:hypothetical protein
MAPTTRGRRAAAGLITAVSPKLTKTIVKAKIATAAGDGPPSPRSNGNKPDQARPGLAPSAEISDKPKPTAATRRRQKDLNGAEKSEPTAKKRRTKQDAALHPPEPTTCSQIIVETHPYTPSLLPLTPTISLSHAQTHLEAFDPRFKKLFGAMPCRPFVEPYQAVDPFKTLATSIIGQQVSWMAARAINNRFRALFGYTDEDSFPSPQEVTQKDVLVLKSAGLSLRKAEYGAFDRSLLCLLRASVRDSCLPWGICPITTIYRMSITQY